MNTDWNTATIIYHRDAVVFLNLDIDIRTITGEGFVNTIVDNFPYQMVKAFAVCWTDIHPLVFYEQLPIPLVPVSDFHHNCFAAVP